MVKQAGVWKAYSYLWNKDQTDATLLEGNAKVQVKQTDPSNAANNIAFTHTVPNRTECMQCHTAAAGRVLGLETLQINGDFNYNGVKLGPTISIGVATFPEDVADPQDLFTTADRALYKAKRGGRNRVETVTISGLGHKPKKSD